jgi:hypothetical protein
MICFIWGYFAWANSTYYYFPENYDTDESVHLSITASWPNNSLDYYPWGYWVFVNTNTEGKRLLSSFEIKDPALSPTQSYSTNPVCDSNWEPFLCYSMKYYFEWTEPSWRTVASEIPAHQYAWQTWYIDMYSDILANAKDFSTWDDLIVTEINIRAWIKDIFLVKTFFWDDIFSLWISSQKDISKKFVFRTKKTESTYIWVAHSDDKLWEDDWKIKAENMKYLNFATVHVKENTHWEIVYKARVEPGDSEVKFITLDMDNRWYDTNSTPELWHSYIDVYLKRDNVITWSREAVNRDWGFEDTPIYRISADANWYTFLWKTIPSTDTTKIGHSVWPSGSFLCNEWTIWTPQFIDCYNDPKYLDENGQFKWITQYTIPLPTSNEYQFLYFKLHNSSTAFGNAFAIAWDIDLFSNEIPEDSVIASANDVAWVMWVTTVEVDTQVPDGENGFNDDWVETKIWYLHTYKTEICNNTNAQVTNVFINLYEPIKSTLLDVTSSDILDSTLMLNGTNLDSPVDDAKKLPIALFNSNINIWVLNPWECKYVSYQTMVENNVVQWDILSVQNEFTYDWWTTKQTNQVTNSILAMSYDASINLSADPVSWSDMYNLDYITYSLLVTNNGLTEIWTWSLSCPRFVDTLETTCKAWECWSSTYNFNNLHVWWEIEINYTVQTTDLNSVWDIITEQCNLEFVKADLTSETRTSNDVSHTIIERSTAVAWWSFSLELYSRPKLLNTPDWELRPDGADVSPIKYTYKYTGSNHDYMYPEVSNAGTTTVSRSDCEYTHPYKLNSVTYNINSSSTSSRDSLSLSSNNIDFQFNTTLPSVIPKTILSSWTLTPTHYVSWDEANSWFKDGWTKEAPISSTEHRAMVNGTDWRIESNVAWTPTLDTWKYVPSWDEYSCDYYHDSDNCDGHTWNTPLYHWEMIYRETLNFNADNYRFVTVWGSTAWLKTENGHVHTNNNLTEDWTSANTYDLWEVWYTSVVSAPKLYSPPGSSHWDYVVSTNTPSTNLESKKGRYLYNKVAKQWHGYVYDRETNARDFYIDLIDKQKFWPVQEEGEDNLANPLWEINLELNNVYYYPWDLTIEDSSWMVYVKWNKWTIVVGWDLYINSDVTYFKEAKDDIKKLAYLGIIVKWSVYIDGWVTDTVWSWHVDWMLHTWDSVYTLRHLGSWTADSFDFQRQAPEHYERDVNEPSEWIVFNDQVYFTTPPWFAELDDGIWSYKTNINQFTWEEVEW